MSTLYYYVFGKLGRKLNSSRSLERKSPTRELTLPFFSFHSVVDDPRSAIMDASRRSPILRAIDIA